MNRRPQITPPPPDNDRRQRELRLIDHLRRQGLTVRAGWLVDQWGNVYRHGRIVAAEKAHSRNVLS